MGEYDNKRGSSLNYDEILKHVGQFGKFQIRIFLLLCLVSTASGMAVVVWAFTGFRMKHRCVNPYCESLTNASYFDASNTNSSFLSLPRYAMKGKNISSQEENHQCTFMALENIEQTSTRNTSKSSVIRISN